jgi:LPS export ABC transporter protein LptC
LAAPGRAGRRDLRTAPTMPALRHGAAAALALLAAVTGCSGRSGPAATPPPASPAASAAARQAKPVPIHLSSHRVGSKYIYLREQKKNRLVYVLRADSNTSIRLAEGAGRSEFQNPHVTFYNGPRTIVADAPLATAEERDRSVLMSGGVHAITDKGMTLTSDTMRYDDAAERLHGEGNVVVTTPQGEELRGDTLDYDLRTTEMHVTGSAK